MRGQKGAVPGAQAAAAARSSNVSSLADMAVASPPWHESSASSNTGVAIWTKSRRLGECMRLPTMRGEAPHLWPQLGPSGTWKRTPSWSAFFAGGRQGLGGESARKGFYSARRRARDAHVSRIHGRVLGSDDQRSIDASRSPKRRGLALRAPDRAWNRRRREKIVVRRDEYVRWTGCGRE